MGGTQSKTPKGRGDAQGNLYENQLISINIKKKRKPHGDCGGKLRRDETSLSIDSVLTNNNNCLNIQNNSHNHRNSNNNNNNKIRWTKLVDGTISTPAFDKISISTCNESIGGHPRGNRNRNNRIHNSKGQGKVVAPENQNQYNDHTSDGQDMPMSLSNARALLVDDDDNDEKTKKVRELKHQPDFDFIPPPKIRLQILSPVHSRHQQNHNHDCSRENCHLEKESQLSFSPTIARVQRNQNYGENNSANNYLTRSIINSGGGGGGDKEDAKLVFIKTSSKEGTRNCDTKLISCSTVKASSTLQSHQVSTQICKSNNNNTVASQSSLDSETNGQPQIQMCRDKNVNNNANSNDENSSKKLVQIYQSPKMIITTFSDESESVLSHPRYHHVRSITNAPTITTPAKNKNNSSFVHNNYNLTNNNNGQQHSFTNETITSALKKTGTAPNPRIPHSVLPTTRETLSTAASKGKLKVRGLKNFVDSHKPCPPLWAKQFPCRSKFHPDNYLYDFEGANAPKRPVRAMGKCPKKCGRCNRCGVYTDAVCRSCHNCAQDCKCGAPRRPPAPPAGVPTPYAPTPTAEHFISQLFGPNWQQTQKIQVNPPPAEPDKPKLNLHLCSSNNPLKLKNSKPSLATGYDTYTPATDQSQQAQNNFPPPAPYYGNYSAYPPPSYPAPYPYYPSYMPVPAPYYGYSPPPPLPLPPQQY